MIKIGFAQAVKTHGDNWRQGLINRHFSASGSPHADMVDRWYHGTVYKTLAKDIPASGRSHLTITGGLA